MIIADGPKPSFTIRTDADRILEFIANHPQVSINVLEYSFRDIPHAVFNEWLAVFEDRKIIKTADNRVSMVSGEEAEAVETYASRRVFDFIFKNSMVGKYISRNEHNNDNEQAKNKA